MRMLNANLFKILRWGVKRNRNTVTLCYPGDFLQRTHVHTHAHVQTVLLYHEIQVKFHGEIPEDGAKYFNSLWLTPIPHFLQPFAAYHDLIRIIIQSANKL